jgi:phosphomannomutase
MKRALADGKKAVCGWEANGGFMTASTINRAGKSLRPLPTRDAMLPVLGVLAAAEEAGVALPELFARLPQRFNRATLIREFPRELSSGIVTAFTAAPLPAAIAGLAPIFSAARSFAEIDDIDRTDGLRLLFRDGDVVHLRPSGNADEFRIYATADTPERADWIALTLAKHPDGMIQELQEASVSGHL